MLLEVLFGDKDLVIPLASEERLILLGGQLQQVLVSGEGLLLELELLLECSVLIALLRDRGSDLLRLLVGVLIVQVQALG